jgi:hypothetical protein
VDKRNANSNSSSSSASVNWMYVIVLVVALAVFGVGIFLAVQDSARRDWTMLAAGCVGLVLVLTTWPLAMTLSAARDTALQRSEETLGVLQDRLQAISVLMNEMSEQQLLSDRAKSVAFREKDRDALRRAIREDIAKRDWEAALILADEMERQFGYKQEAMKFREDIHRAQDDVIRRQINDGMAIIDRHCRAEAWSDALREAERLTHAFRNDPQAQNLPQEVENRRR